MGAGGGAGRGLRSLSAWPAASGLGWLPAPPRSGRVSGRPCGFPGCVARRLGAGCGAGSSFAQSSLPLSSPPRRASVCVCVLGASLGTRGSLSHLPRRRRRRHCLWLPTLGGDSGATGEAPGEGAGRAGRPRPPVSRGRGCRSPLRSLLFGAPRLPLSPCSRPSVRLGVGMSQRRPPLASHGNLGGGDEAPPPTPGAGLEELRGVLGADSPFYLARPPPPDSHVRLPPPR